MTVICEEDVIASVADALQYISYYHTPDFIQAMGRAYTCEQSPAARDAIAQILTNSRMCAEGHRPLCQDTGIVVVFVKRAARLAGGIDARANRDLETRRAPDGSGGRRNRGSCRSHHGKPHGSLHGNHAGEGRAAGDGR